MRKGNIMATLYQGIGYSVLFTTPARFDKGEKMKYCLRKKTMDDDCMLCSLYKKCYADELQEEE